MKIKVSNTELLKAVNTVSRAIEAKSSAPVMLCVYLQASGQRLFLKGTGDELSIITSINASVETEGEVLIPFRTLSEIIRTYPDAEVTLSADENNVIQITCQNSDVKIQGSDKNEYPKFAAVNTDNFITVSNITLRSMIRETSFVCSFQEGLSPIMNGILVESSEKQLTLTALNGYMLAVRTEKTDDYAVLKCVVPVKSMTEIFKVLSIYEDSDAMFHVSDNKFVVNIGDTQIISNLLAGEFVNYRAIIPGETNTIVKIERKNIINCVERASILFTEIKNGLIKMNIEDNYMVITSESEIGRTLDNIQINKNGDDLTVAFNPRLIYEILKNISDSRFIMEFRDGLSPVLCKPVDSEKYLYLLMPLRY